MLYGHNYVPKTHFEPYQNPKAYPQKATKFIAPNPSPVNIPYLKFDKPTLLKHYLYLFVSCYSPTSCFTVLIEDIAL